MIAKTIIESDGTIHSELCVFRPRTKGYGFELWTSKDFNLLPNQFINNVPTYWGLISVVFVAIRNVHELGHDVETIANNFSEVIDLYFPDDCLEPFKLHCGQEYEYTPEDD